MARADGYLSSSEAARHVGVSKCTLLRAVRRGAVRAARRTPGGQFRFHADDLAAYARALAAPPDGPSARPPVDLVGGLTRLAALPTDGAPACLAAAVLDLLAEMLSVGAVLVARPDGPVLRIAHVLDRAGLGLRAGMTLPGGDGYGADLLMAAHPLAVSNTRADPRFAALATTHLLGIGAYSGVPLRAADGRPYGTLCTLHPEARVVGEGELALLTLAGRAVMQAADRAAARAREEQLGQEAAARAAELATVIEHLPCGVVVVDAIGRVAVVNELGRRIGGPTLDVEQPLAAQAPAYAIRPDPSSPPLTQPDTPIARALADEVVPARVATIRRPGDAEDRVVETTAVPLHDAAGGVRGAIAVFTDVTARVDAERTLRAREEQYRTIVETMQEGIWVRDAADRTTFVNGRMAALLGATVEELRGASVEELRGRPPAAFASAADADLWRARRARLRAGVRETFDVALRRADGSPLWVQISSSPLVDAEGGYAGAVALVSDISARKRMEEGLRHQAMHDMLTSLPNRALLEAGIAQAFADVAAPGPLALLLLDLDRFTEINNTFGRAAGDALLWQVAGRLQGAVRQTDTVARLGGDEFAVLLPASDAVAARQVAHRLQATLTAPFAVAGQRLRVGATIGVAVAPEQGTAAATLLRRADVALCAAKRTREDIGVYEAAQDQHSPERLALVGELWAAIAAGALTLHYQPQVDVASGHVRGAEALVRWPHPERGLIPPDQFIPLAEQTGLIGPLTEWVLAAAIRQCCAWHRTGMRLTVSVNLSMRNLHDPALPELIARLLREHGVAPAWLQLELTEGTLMADAARTLAVLTRLHDLGVGLAVDDFGSGYSSLAYLKRLPVDELKIDKGFVRHLATDAADAAIVASTVQLGHALGLRVVAEGIEDQASWEHLAALGCDIAQGYYVSRPLPPETLAPWLHDVASRAA